LQGTGSHAIFFIVAALFLGFTKAMHPKKKKKAAQTLAKKIAQALL